LNQKESNYKLHYTDLCWLFFGGSILGYFLEGLWRIYLYGRWENHSSTVWGPFCIIYGFGALVLFLLAHILQGKNIFVQTISYVLAGSGVEYFGSLFLELCFGVKSWDYSKDAFNIGGRICLRMAIVWGILGIGFAYLAFPYLKKLFMRMRGKTNNVICILLIIFMLINLVVTSAAIWRWGERVNGDMADNFIEECIDRFFGNERMNKIFHNMRFVN